MMSMVSISVASFQFPVSQFLSQFEFHCDFDHHVHWRAESFRRREPPLPHGFDRALIETAAETAKHFDVSDGAVGAHHDFEFDVPGDTTTARFLGVVGPDLAHDARWRDSGSGPVRTAAGAATATRTDSGTCSFTDSCPLTGAGAAAAAGSVTVGILRVRKDAGLVGRVGGSLRDRCDHLRQRLRRGRRRRLNGLRDWLGRGRWRSLSSAPVPADASLGPRRRHGTTPRAAPFILAAGGGAGCFRPPPPPPPPGPGVARKTSRIWVVGSASGAATPIVNNRKAKSAARGAPRRRTAHPENVSWTERAPKMARSSAVATAAPRNIRTMRIASASATKRPSIVRIAPSAISARTSAVETPAAAAISRAVNTSGTVALMEDMVDLAERGKRLAVPADEGKYVY